MAGQDTDLPIFDVQRVQLRFDISADFVAAQVANNVLILALGSGRILRFDLDNAEDIDDIDLPSRPAEVGIIRKVFLDPSASHLIITTTLGSNFYLHTQSRQPKPLARLKGVQIECVAWNPALPTASTREILIGSSDGNIYEAYIEPSSEFYRREEKYVKNVYRSQYGPVVGLWVDSAASRPDIRRVLVATPSVLLQFAHRPRTGTADASAFYTKLFESEQPQTREVREEIRGRAAALAVSPDSAADHGGRDQERSFGWLASDGIVAGVLTDPASAESTPRSLSSAKAFTKSKFVSQADSSRRKSYAAQQSISALAVSQFHILALVGDRLVAVNRLDESVVYDQKVVEQNQNVLGMYVDIQKNTFWLLTQREIYEIVVTDETRDVWKIMLSHGNYDGALRYASTPEQKDAVAIATGDDLLEKGNYLEAAGVLGRSSKAFEDVTLALIDHGDNDALRRYLSVKLSELKKGAQMQRLMIASWLVELFMVKLNTLDDAISTAVDGPDAVGQSQKIGDLPKVRQEFQDFVRRNKADLDQKTVYEIISSHGREEELLHFATAIDDYRYVLSYWVQRGRWTDAMSVLKRQSDPDTFYRYSSVLMEHLPQELVEVLMRQSNLDDSKLIPALLSYNKTTNVALGSNQAVRYLQYCINQQGSADPAIHNTLVSIFASSPGSDESFLLAYLKAQSTASHQYYDADFALRLCISHQRVRSAVLIYTAMSQFAAAIDLALKHDEIELAADVADRPGNDQALRKKLWLKVAKKVMESSRGISAAIEFLKRCELLRIEDLIPLFPDFVVIDDFKEQICVALEDYSRQIDNLRLEMDRSADTSQNIKDDIKALDQRYAIVEPGERCWLCRLPLLMRQFFVFPCQHAFHADCLGKAVINMGPAGKGKRIRELQSEIGRGVVNARRKDRLVKELDGHVAGACVLCGDMAVKQIDQPFVSTAEDNRQWAI